MPDKTEEACTTEQFPCEDLLRVEHSTPSGECQSENISEVEGLGKLYVEEGSKVGFDQDKDTDHCVEASHGTRNPVEEYTKLSVEVDEDVHCSSAKSSTGERSSVKSVTVPATMEYKMESSTLVHQHLEQQTTVPKRILSPAGELVIPLFYSGKGVLITGATGFIGKVLIEKLLRCCPELECIYCLIRPKNQQTIEGRLEEITNSKVSNRFLCILLCLWFNFSKTKYTTFRLIWQK